MPVVDKDYIVRVIKQIADLFSRVLKLVERREYDQALRALEAGCPSLLGLEYAALTFVDAEAAARLLGDKDRVKIFAQLVAKEAELLELKDHSSAPDKRRLALELWAEALLRAAPADDAQKTALRVLRERVGESVLLERYRASLAKTLDA